jgi:hypothetical protein
MGEKRGAYRVFFLCENLMEGNDLEDPSPDGRIILKLVFEKWNGAWTGSIWLRIGTGGGLL